MLDKDSSKGAKTSYSVIMRIKLGTKFFLDFQTYQVFWLPQAVLENKPTIQFNLKTMCHACGIYDVYESNMLLCNLLLLL